MTGMDLLAKFLYGDKPNKVGERFEKCIREIDDSLKENDLTILFQLRNSLSHSFGLYSKDHSSNFHLYLSRVNPTNIIIEENIYK